MSAAELQQAVRDCRARALYASAKWAASALCGLPQEELAAAAAAGGTGAAAAPTPPPAYELARCLFDSKVGRPSDVRVCSPHTSGTKPGMEVENTRGVPEPPHRSCGAAVPAAAAAAAAV